MTGPAGFVADLVTAFGGIDGVLLLVALGAVLLILVLVYRSPFLPFVVIFTAVFALCLAGLVVYNLAANGTLVLNGQSQGILSILVVGASVDYALLLVARYREELAHVEHPAEAMKRALRACVEPIAASAGTVIAGVLCLLLSDLGSNRSLGPVAAIGIASALLGALTLLPALLLVVRQALARPVLAACSAPAARRRPRRPSTRTSTPRSSPTLPTAPGLWPRLARFVGRKAQARVDRHGARPGRRCRVPAHPQRVRAPTRSTSSSRTSTRSPARRCSPSTSRRGPSSRRSSSSTRPTSTRSPPRPRASTAWSR